MGRFFALLAVIFFAPLHVVIAALIFLHDGGPVFYRPKRLGKNGRPFAMFKYRSMRVGAAPIIDERFQTIVRPHDERVTSVGRMLRCGLDEVPQLLNVIRGEMAWIGPRPDELWMLPYYGPTLRERLSVLPGISGLAQVSDSRNLRTEQAYALDIWAVRHSTAALTMRIVVRTPLFLLGWRKAEHTLTNPEVLELEQACQLGCGTGLPACHSERQSDRPGGLSYQY